MSFADLFKNAIFPSLGATDKSGVIQELLESLAERKMIPKKEVDSLTAEVVEREQLGSTGIGKGIGIPHIKTDLVKELTCALGTSEEGIDFAAIDGDPVYTIFLILAPNDDNESYLNLLRWISSLARNRDFCRFIRMPQSSEDIQSLLHEMTSA